MTKKILINKNLLELSDKSNFYLKRYFLCLVQKVYLIITKNIVFFSLNTLRHRHFLSFIARLSRTRVKVVDNSHLCFTSLVKMLSLTNWLLSCQHKVMGKMTRVFVCVPRALASADYRPWVAIVLIKGELRKHSRWTCLSPVSVFIYKINLISTSLILNKNKL